MTSGPKSLAMPVALPVSSFSRHTNPGEASASALMRSRLATKSASSGESSGARSRAMLSCASSRTTGVLRAVGG